MLQAVHRFLCAQSQARITLGALILVAVIGATDRSTGYELSASIFYLLPLSVTAWYVGARAGFAMCLLAAATWLLVDYTSGHQYTYFAVPFWNAGVRLGFFVIVAYLLVNLRNALALQASLAQQDGLTGITNARTFRQRYELLAHLAIRYGRPVTLGYIDLDGFKGVNDSLGHTAGDRALKAVAAELAKRLRTSDVVGRLGGDEFALLLMETDLVGAQTLFTDIRERLLAVAEQNRWPLGFSIGVAVFHAPPESSEEAIKRADALMYKVKRAGKNGILFEEYNGDIRSAQP
jgi:diguanylate cyclase (GGDEF)-like protein